jgi:nicotinate phosphoribosyltransferase
VFHTASWKDVREGLVTDIYFERTKNMLEAKEVDVRVRAEFVAHIFPSNWPWAVFAGVEECAQILEDLPVDELKENY